MHGGSVTVRPTLASPLTVRCPAKVNLHLEVLGKRADGYHELRTVFAAVGVWDELVLEPAPEGVVTLAVEPAGVVSADEGNLVVRAAHRLLRQLPGARGVRMTLRKRIPVAAGLGGGSSDAAAALAGLALLWGADGSWAGLQPVAAALGADVPYFLVGGTALGSGRGCEVEPLPDLPPLWAVLIPGRKVSTAAVYAALHAGPVREWDGGAIQRWAVEGGPFPFAACRNELQGQVVQTFPRVEENLRLLRETGPLLSLVAGSGATVFALYEHREVAAGVAQELAGRGALVAPLLSRVASQQPLLG